jgi:hypothetical protein
MISQDQSSAVMIDDAADDVGSVLLRKASICPTRPMIGTRISSSREASGGLRALSRLSRQRHVLLVLQLPSAFAVNGHAVNMH